MANANVDLKCCSGGRCSIVHIQVKYADGTTEQALPTTLDELCENPYQYRFAEKAGTSVIVASANRARKCTSCRTTLSQTFLIPDIWWSESTKRSNGYFGYKDFAHMTDDGEKPDGCASWSRFQVKTFKLREEKQKPLKYYTYSWGKLNSYSRWYENNHTVVILFCGQKEEDVTTNRISFDGTNLEMFSKCLLEPHATVRELKDPFWVYVRLLPNLVELLNDSVWKTRTMVRDNVEKIRQGRDDDNKQTLSEIDRWDKKGRNPAQKLKPANPDYSALHDIARHVIHVYETLVVSAGTVECIQKYHKEFHDDRHILDDDQGLKNNRRSSKLTITSRNISQDISHVYQVLTGNMHRAEANKSRLQNEISLAFNQVSQEDSFVSVDIAKATRLDSAAMRTLAVVTTFFLPGTFISAVFSTSFFNFQQDKEKGDSWKVSDRFWIYWVVLAVVTSAVVGIWFGKRAWFEPPAIMPVVRVPPKLEEKGGGNE